MPPGESRTVLLHEPNVSCRDQGRIAFALYRRLPIVDSFRELCRIRACRQDERGSWGARRTDLSAAPRPLP